MFITKKNKVFRKPARSVHTVSKTVSDNATKNSPIAEEQKVSKKKNQKNKKEQPVSIENNELENI